MDSIREPIYPQRTQATTMEPGSRFAKRVFFGAGLYGIVVLLPMFFLEKQLGGALPSLTPHPEQYYGFVGVALAWQFAFLGIARDPERHRPLMLAAIAEKLLPAGAVLWLVAVGRVRLTVAAPFFVDLGLGALFLVSFFRSGRRSAGRVNGGPPSDPRRPTTVTRATRAARSWPRRTGA